MNAGYPILSQSLCDDKRFAKHDAFLLAKGHEKESKTHCIPTWLIRWTSIIYRYQLNFMSQLHKEGGFWGELTRTIPEPDWLNIFSTHFLVLKHTGEITYRCPCPIDIFGPSPSRHSPWALRSKSDSKAPSWIVIHKVTLEVPTIRSPKSVSEPLLTCIHRIPYIAIPASSVQFLLTSPTSISRFAPFLTSFPWRRWDRLP